MDRTLSEGDEDTPKFGRTPIVRASTSSEDEEKSGPDLSEALVIRPSMILIGKPDHPPITLSVDRLESSDRDMYLRDFFPPNPAVVKNDTGETEVPPFEHSDYRQNPTAASKEPKKMSDWPVVAV